MKLKRPINLQTISDVEVTDCGVYNRDQGFIEIPVAVKAADGRVVQQLRVILRRGEKVIRERGGRTVETVEGAQSDVLVRNPEPQGDQHFRHATRALSPEAFDRALAARKAPDEFAALEAAGLADGWLDLGNEEMSARAAGFGSLAKKNSEGG